MTSGKCRSRVALNVFIGSLAAYGALFWAPAAHVATAAVHGMDFLLTWNCRHIANAAIVEKLRDICEREGFPAPVICTPHELMV